MRRRGITPKVGFYLFVAFVITCCFISGPNELWHRAYRIGGIYLSLGAILTALFFRKRMVTLLICALSIILPLAGTTVLFHPSVAGFIFTIGSAIALYVLVVWDTRRHPELQGGDWRKTFFGE
jgi:hypothetical protein